MSSMLRHFTATATAAFLTVAPACAGEADHEPDDTHEHGAAYFGEAKDIATLDPVSEVRIKAQVRGTTRFFIIQTDDDGRFRRAGMGSDVDPEKVDITCEKAGFRTVEVMRRRASAAKDAAVEIECLMEKAN
jgi:hypothetical protein